MFSYYASIRCIFCVHINITCDYKISELLADKDFDGFQLDMLQLFWNYLF